MIPLRWIGRPCAFQAAGDGVLALPCAEHAHPTEALILYCRTSRVGTDVAWWSSTVCLAEGMTTRNQRHRLLIPHGHATKAVPDVLCRHEWIRDGIGAFRVHVDQLHVW